MSVVLSASILGADLGRLADDARAAIDAGCRWLHVDVMDGHFVPNISFGVPVMKAIGPLAKETNTLLDVHLMIAHPERYLADFAAAGADVLTVHQEACPHLHRTVQQIKELGCRAGVAVNPATPISTLEEIAADIDLLLVMSVNPGFAGQQYIPATTAKLRKARRMLRESGSNARLQVDGGVTPQNAREATDAGADVLVAASALFKNGPVADNVRAFEEALAIRV